MLYIFRVYINNKPKNQWQLCCDNDDKAITLGQGMMYGFFTMFKHPKIEISQGERGIIHTLT